jgi:hypothetical protein
VQHFRSRQHATGLAHTDEITELADFHGYKKSRYSVDSNCILQISV